MRTIWVVRHGERIDNVDREWRKRGAAPRGHWDDPHLTERGRQQATEVGLRLNKEAEQIDFIFSSPFTRCLETTENIVRQLKHKPPVFIEAGFCESLHTTQKPPGFPDLDEALKTHRNISTLNSDYKPFFTKETLPKNETSCNCCFVRVSQTLNHLLQNFDGNILIVSHGSPIAGCHFAFLGDYAYTGQCTISKYEVLEGREKRGLEESEPSNTAFEPDAVETHCRQNNLKVVDNKENKGVEKDPKLTTYHHSNLVLHKKSVADRPLTDVPTSGIVRIPGVKALLIGDKSHLSDPRNLREDRP